jgi:dihydropyrimidinase
VVSAANSQQRTDYNLYEGWEITGLPEKVYRRGELIVDRTAPGHPWLGKAGTGRWTPRASHAPIL